MVCEGGKFIKMVCTCVECTSVELGTTGLKKKAYLKILQNL